MSQILPCYIYFEKVIQPNTGSNTIVLKHTHVAPLAEKYLNVFISQSAFFALPVTKFYNQQKLQSTPLIHVVSFFRLAKNVLLLLKAFGYR